MATLLEEQTTDVASSAVNYDGDPVTIDVQGNNAASRINLGGAAVVVEIRTGESEDWQIRKDIRSPESWTLDLHGVGFQFRVQQIGSGPETDLTVTAGGAT